MKAILLRRPGGPEALEYVEVPTPVPGEGKVLVKADTIGVSMPEVLVRRGTYAWMPALPAIPGIELSGTVVAHGPNTAEPALGQPVFVSARDLPARAGCYAEYIAVPARAAHPLPPGCSLEAAACLSNYQVAYHVLHTAARGVEAKRVLVHTAAGGVGSAAVQLALIAGLEVIGVAGSEKKTRAILGLSAQHAIDYRSEDVVARVRELMGGRGGRSDPRPDRRQGLWPQFRYAGAARDGGLLRPPRRPARRRSLDRDAGQFGQEPGGALLHDP
jgi:NADPH:quinone reductase